ncbi:MAG TPA: hypothetical protein H9871_00475 [Candidatus Nesterenkonia stercoripullorum]|uniref:Uncharacterized protein n=1 Tax=Candidatus Nesterenkonia stercoripullorum TaxID=2838701 RepID=A0A9D1S110_9MICC|nr:hypothetical protein [Candidatus Nesterenkonia stercoripullorum]
MPAIEDVDGPTAIFHAELMLAEVKDEMFPPSAVVAEHRLPVLGFAR